MKKVTLYTDGACSGNPGPGGWCAILIYKDKEKQLSGFEPMTTNNRMELTALIEGLKALKEKCEVQVVSDSQYIVDAINKGWLDNWVHNGFMRKDNKPVVNPDLWRQLLELMQEQEVTFTWVKGHDKTKYNNLCDRVATGEIAARIEGEGNPDC